VACAFDGGRHFALILKRIARNTTGKDFALFVYKLQEEICIFIIDVFNPEFAKTAIFFAVLANFGIAQEFDIISGGCHDGNVLWLDKNDE
jgi:hypothetical protein